MLVGQQAKNGATGRMDSGLHEEVELLLPILTIDLCIEGSLISLGFNLDVQVHKPCSDKNIVTRDSDSLNTRVTLPGKLPFLWKGYFYGFVDEPEGASRMNIKRGR